MIYALIEYDIFINYKIQRDQGDFPQSCHKLYLFTTLAELCYLVVLSHWERHLNGLEQWSWRCCLSARGYSPTAGPGEGSVPAQPVLILCELKATSLTVQGNSHAVKPHTTATRMSALSLPPSQCWLQGVKSWGTDCNWSKIKPDRKCTDFSMSKRGWTNSFYHTKSCHI